MSSASVCKRRDQRSECTLYYFDVYGPYAVDTHDGKCKPTQTEMWNDIGVIYPELHGAIGCYLFCMEFRHRIRPWYVGMTVAKAGFRGEAFQPHKIAIYNECLEKQKGRPIIFFIPLLTEGTGEFSKARTSGKKVIQWLETTLMGFAFRRNPEISNIKDMHYLRNVEVLGLLGKRRGRPFREAQAIRRALIG